MRLSLFLLSISFFGSLFGQQETYYPPVIALEVSDTSPQVKDSIYFANPLDSALTLPQFPGGQKGLVKWLSSSVIYPEIAVDKGLEDLVKVEFIVLKSGKICCVRLLKKGIPVLDAEAIRVISKSPDWEPGMRNGQTVSTKMLIPIRFKLD